MYSANKKKRRYRLFVGFVLLTIPFFLVLIGLIWFVFFRNTGEESANFSRAGSTIAEVKVSQTILKTDLFTVSLPTGWALEGLKNPVNDEKYYSFKSTIAGFDNRWMRIYVDVFPEKYPINRLMPITLVENKIIPGILSDDCKTFTGAPLDKSVANSASASTWTAKWQGINFVCDMARPQNLIGTASEEEGIGNTIAGSNGQKHRYFFVYIDHNVNPDYGIFTNALKSFQTL